MAASPKNHRVVAVSSDILEFGLGVYQAVLSGEMPPVSAPEADLQWAAVQTLIHYVAGHGLSDDELTALALRVVAFEDLLDHARRDECASSYVADESGAIQITRRLLLAACGAEMTRTPDGRLQYSLSSIVSRLEAGPS
ncbi:hypothetical protein [Pseudoxanthomonas japonensis]|uniref:hypothetical protein n=1 Tax=Pseudoxanthomonas japonensis TaxID=69284 RepID=UPI001BCFC4D3|nr:hypothetical protein [Pseudoxanthomonas japonensis]